MREKMYSFAPPPDIDFSASYIPERGLLAGVLERAYRDLINTTYIVDQADKRDAVCWFLKKQAEDPEFLSFQFVCAHLELSSERINFLVKEAKRVRKEIEEKNKFKSERKTS